MNYQAVLAQHNLTEESLSIKLKKSIKRYLDLAAQLQTAKESLDRVTDRKRAQLEAAIPDSEATLLQLDSEISKGIERYAKNKEFYDKQGERLNALKKPKTAPAPLAAVNPIPVVEELAADPVVLPADPGPTVEEPVADDEKKSSGFGWILTGLIAAAAAGIGINYYNNKR